MGPSNQFSACCPLCRSKLANRILFIDSFSLIGHICFYLREFRRTLSPRDPINVANCSSASPRDQTPHRIACSRISLRFRWLWHHRIHTVRSVCTARVPSSSRIWETNGLKSYLYKYCCSLSQIHFFIIYSFDWTCAGATSYLSRSFVNCWHLLLCVRASGFDSWINHSMQSDGNVPCSTHKHTQIDEMDKWAKGNATFAIANLDTKNKNEYNQMYSIFLGFDATLR